MVKNVNLEIALTHILTRKRQTIIAALGVTIGIGMYIFMNSLMAGFDRYSRGEIFKTNPHVKIFREDETSKPLYPVGADSMLRVITNPALTVTSKAIVNPQRVLEQVRLLSYVTYATPQVSVDVFYNKGDSQRKGIANGINIAEADAMFNIRSTMLSGSLEALQGNLNGIIIGKGLAGKLSLDLGDNVTISSSRGVLKVMKIVGIFSAGNKNIDESKSYINIAAAQQLAKQGTSYITDIYVNTIDPEKTMEYTQDLQTVTPYKVEAWQVTNADMLAGDSIRTIMGSLVSLTIMLVASFGIYNILNMTVTQKLNDIAILKATGFDGKDIQRIFVTEAIFMGILGTFVGVCVGAICIELLSKVYIGGPIGNFPIYFNGRVFVIGTILGLSVTTLAGYLPARKAANVDPVSIFRK